MDVRMPVKPSAIGMDCTEHPDIQPSGSSPIQQVVDGQAAQRIEQMTVMKKQWPQRVREREHQVLPGTIGQTSSRRVAQHWLAVKRFLSGRGL